MSAWTDKLARARRFVTHDVWHTELSSLSGLRNLVARGLRIGELIVRGFREDDLVVHAAALTFGTLMALVPLLAIAFAVLKGLGASDDATARLLELISEMPAEFQHFVATVTGGVSRTSFAALGWIGVVVLFVTVVQVLSSIESSFNRVWGVAASRTIGRRWANYISMTVLVPVLVMAAFAVNTTLHSEAVIRHLGEAAFLYKTLLRLSPLLSIWLALFLLIIFMPNTRVKRGPACFSAFLAAVLWIYWQRAYILFQVELSRYNAIYGTFASVPVFLLWLFVCWMIILLGSEIAFALQNHSTYHMERVAGQASVRARITLAVSVMADAVAAFQRGDNLFSAADYAQRQQAPVRLVNDVCRVLERGGYLAEAADRPGCYLLAKAPERVSVGAVVELLLHDGSQPASLGMASISSAVAEALAPLDQHLKGPLSELTFDRLAAKV